MNGSVRLHLHPQKITAIMTRYQKLLVVIGILLLGWTFAGCGGNASDNAATESSASTENVEETETTAPAAEEAEETATEATDATSDIGVGPVTELELPETIDEELAAKGEELFTSKGCNACHQMDSRLVGPALKGVTQRRNPAWIMNMILAPEKMIKEDPIAKKLFEEYGSPMTNMGVNEDEARAILEYLRQVDAS